VAVVKEQRIGADWLAPGDFSPDEVAEIVHWYSTYHGLGDLTLAPFTSFWLEHDHDVFKGYRLWIEGALKDGFPPVAGGLSHLHYYCATDFPRGALYEAVAARKWGATKQQVLDVMALAFLQGGPAGFGEPAARVTAYLEAWTHEEAEVDPRWPEGWAPSPEAFDAGMDLSVREATDEEVDRLRAWHETHQGSVPSYVELLARYNREGLKAHRRRYEHSASRLPAPLVPLMQLHTAANLGEAEAIRRYARQARHLGATRAQVVPVVARAFVYAGDLRMSTAADVLMPLLEDWA
jgi:hypothetical protein